MELVVKSFTFLWASVAVLAYLIPSPAVAQTPTNDATDICLKSGVLIRGRLEPREGRLFIYVQGSSAASDFTGQINSVGISDDPVCKRVSPTETAGVKFGIRGSNTIGERLMPLIIEGYAKKTYGTSPVVKILGTEHQSIEIKKTDGTSVALIDFQSKGTGTAPTGLKSGESEIGMMSRPMKPEEAEQVKSARNVDVLQPGSEHVVALDGLAVVVHPDNPIKKLDLTTISKIFAGEIKNWNEVSGKDASNRVVNGRDQVISIHARDNKSGTFDTFKAIVLEGQEPKKKIATNANRYESSEALSAAVTKDTGSIGFIGFPYINRNHPLSILSTCGIDSEPRTFLVKLEAYPLSRRLFLYTLGTPKEPVVKSIIDHALSDDAQTTVAETGFIDQKVEFDNLRNQDTWISRVSSDASYGLDAAKDVPTQARRQFEAFSSAAKRTSIVFRFARGESQLDTLARQNIDRLARYIRQQSISPKKVFLVGFADSDGGWGSNKTLAEDRARSVASELKEKGVALNRQQLVSLSYMAPVACNDTDFGKRLNRRVEVWIAP